MLLISFSTGLFGAVFVYGIKKYSLLRNSYTNRFLYKNGIKLIAKTLLLNDAIRKAIWINVSTKHLTKQDNNPSKQN